jgi:tyrosinase
MGDYWSPRDPVFWLHHANVDRIWALWGDKYPDAFPSDSAYLDFAMQDFFDENAMPAGLTVRQTLSTFALGYQYPDQRPPQPPVEAVVQSAIRARAVPEHLRAAAPNQQTADARRPLQVAVSPTPAMRDALARIGRPRLEDHLAAAPLAAETVRLKISGVEKHLPPQAFVRVFLNCDYLGPATTPRDPHYVGSFAFFSHGDPAAGASGQAGHMAAMKAGSGFYFNATDAVRALAVDPDFDFSRLRVGIMPHLRPGTEAPQDNKMLELKPGQVEISVIQPGAPG